MSKEIGYAQNEFSGPAEPDDIYSIESRLIIEPTLVEGLKGFESG
jgi:hypothetical protein